MVTRKSNSGSNRVTFRDLESDVGRAISRRQFMAYAGAAISASLLPASLTACAGGSSQAGLTAEFTASIIRPTDLLSLTVGFVNLALSSDGNTLNPIRPGQPAYLMVDFGPQHILEPIDRTAVDDAASQPPDATPLAEVIAAKSRVVFVVPSGQSLDYSLSSLLTAFETLEMNLAALAVPDTVPTLPQAPTPLETAIELPTRLVLTPSQSTGWAHALVEVTSMTSQRTELWHTRLGVRVGGVVDESDQTLAQRTVRAVWSRDPGFAPSIKPPTVVGDSTPWADLGDAERAAIVFESANRGTFLAPRTPTPVQVNRLILTALGGWLDVQGDFGDTPEAGLSEWQHRATMGRDQCVQIVATGVLYPFGHRAALATMTERDLTNGAQAMWQRQTITVSEPTVVLDPGTSAALAQSLRQLPFSELTITTLTTPDLIVKTSASVPLLADSMLPFAFKVVGVDHSGREVHFETPAVWVPTTGGQVATATAQADLEALFQAAMPTVPLGGQRVSFAPENAASLSAPNGATFETQSISLQGSLGPDWPGVGAGKAPFVPQLRAAEIAVEPLRGFGNVGDTIVVSYHEAFVEHGFDGPTGQNVGELVLQLAAPVAVDFSEHTDQSGGILSPNFAVSAISRNLGPVAGAADAAGHAALKIAQGKFNAADFFAHPTGIPPAKILGVFSLVDVVAPGDLDLEQAPVFAAETLDDVETVVLDAARLSMMITAVETSLTGRAMALPKALSDVRTAATLLTSEVTAATTAAAAATAAATLATFPALLAQVPSALDAQTAAIPPNIQGQLRAASATVSQGMSALAPTFASLLTAYQGGQRPPKNLVLRAEWNTQLAASSATAPVFVPTGGLLLSAELRLKVTRGKPAGSDLFCGLEAFDINLGGPTTFASIHFDRLQFILAAGRKASIDVVLAPLGVELKGPLSFLQKASRGLPLDGFSAQSSLLVSPSAGQASYSSGLPALAVGAFSPQNVAIAADLKIPFTGDPLFFRLALSKRDDPFLITAASFGGAGFLGIAVNPDGVDALEGAFEFGACLSVDFGLASSSVAALAGLYFNVESGVPALTGFFRFRGQLDTLGVIASSIELYIDLTYEPSSTEVRGAATLDLHVGGFFFNQTASLMCQMRFSNANKATSFTDVMRPADATDEALAAAAGSAFVYEAGYDPWQEYIDAFA